MIINTRVKNAVDRKLAEPIGDTFFVDSVNGNSAYSGTSWRHAVATLDPAADAD